jgi:hypothetical protein
MTKPLEIVRGDSFSEARRTTSKELETVDVKVSRLLQEGITTGSADPVIGIGARPEEMLHRQDAHHASVDVLVDLLSFGIGESSRGWMSHVK